MDQKLPLQFAPLPAGVEQTSTLPSLLTALSGLGLNIAGAFTGAGAAGNQTLSLASQLNEDAQRRLAEREKYQKQRSIGESLAPRVQADVSDPRARAEILTRIGQYDVDGATAQYNREVSERRGERRLADNDARQMAQSLALEERNLVNRAKELEKNLPPEVLSREGDERFFAAQTKRFTSPEDLREAYNQRRDVKKKLNYAEAVQLYEDYRSYLTSLKGDGFWAAFKPLPRDPKTGKELAPAQLFKGYAAKTLSPEVQQQFTQAKSELDSTKQEREYISKLRQRLINPKTRRQAMNELARMTQDQRVPAGSPPPGAIEVRNKKTGALGWKLPDGRVIPK